MFSKILIANRGEIACRIIKTARKMGIRTVAIYSDADRKALHVSMADEAVWIGAAPSRESYLAMEKVISAAKKTGAQAIHPGYGFLSENAEFCRLCQEEGIVFIGPPAAAIDAMGSKSAAKSIMEKAAVPLVPGYHGQDQNPSLLRDAAESMGYPVLLKAVAGGGGKGMRQVWHSEEFDEALAAAQREALSGFGNDHMLVEKYLTQPRHVELQVFCDQHGNAVYLFERDCSVQRRHQKVIEEAPAPGLSQALRQKMGEAAVKAAQAIAYEGAGTVEFLLDTDGSFYFMEMNTRLQVEHPVTEMITGQDLVEWQLRVAYGEQLPLSQDQLSIHGHAFEARIYAEDPDNEFLPDTGRFHYLQPPRESEHIRVETGVLQGDEVSQYYDPMIAKLVTWDENRERALERLAQALSEYRISGVTTNIRFLYRLATSTPFIQADLNTGFIEQHRATIFRDSGRSTESSIPMAYLYLLLRREQNRLVEPPHACSPWNSVNGWRLNQPAIQSDTITLNGQAHSVTAEETGSGSEPGSERCFSIKTDDRAISASGYLEGNLFHVDINGHRQQVCVTQKDTSQSEDSYTLFLDSELIDFQLAIPDYGEDAEQDNLGSLTAPMNGTVIAVKVSTGDQVSKGQTLVIMEAMKMEHAIQAPHDGVVDEVYYSTGDLVDGGKALLTLLEQ